MDKESFEETLYVSPYIESNKTDEGRKAAEVTGLGWAVKSYSGLITVNKEYSSHMFFWYFPSERKPAEVPLIIWLNGLSTASTCGVLLQNGPYSLLDPTLKPRETSWHKYYNIVYIDNPVGIGFSYTTSERGYSTDFNQVTENLWSALDQFLRLFPELRSREIYIAGLSLGAKYIIPLAYRLKQEKSINLQGIFIGNPLLDPVIQLDFSTYLIELGLINQRQKRDLEAKEEEIRHIYDPKDCKAFYNEFLTYIANEKSTIANLCGLKSAYEYSSNFLDQSFYLNYISSDDVRKALHVSHVKFDNGSKVMSFSAKIVSLPVSDLMQELLEDTDILIYVGQTDIACAYPMIVNVLKSLNWTGKEGYLRADREKLQSEPDGEAWGYRTNHRTLTEVLVRNAGHSAVSNQPQHVLHLLHTFTKYQRF